MELVRWMVYLRRNVAPLAMLSKAVARNAVGIGIFPIALTNDEEWNNLAEDIFDNWASNASVCDAHGLRKFWQKQRRIPDLWLTKGEAFELRAKSPTGQQ